MLCSKTQIVHALAQELGAAVKDKHLKVIASAEIETRFEGGHRITELLVVRDRPHLGAEMYHLLTFEGGTLYVSQLSISSATEALVLHANKLTDLLGQRNNLRAL